MRPDSPSFAIAARVFAPFGLGYFVSYVYRVINAVLAPDLAMELGIDPAQLGLLTSAYFFTFAAFQVPLGVLLDRYGARKIESLLLIVAAAGAAVFGASHTLYGLVLGRGLIGLGVSACLMAAFKAFVVWFPKQQLPVINGLQMAAGGFGAWAASFPVNAALSVTDWRGIFFMLAALTVVVAAVIFIIVPERDLPTSAPPLGELIRDMARLFTRLAFWRVAPMATLSQATYLSIHSLWAGPWMRDMAGLERDAVAAVLSYLALAMMAGYTLIGVAAERISRRGVKLMDLAVGGMALFVVVVALLTVPGNHYPVPLWMVFGFLGTTGILTYAALTQIFPAAMAGRINAALNLLVLIAAFGFQWGIGAIINLWPATADGGYAPDGYKTAFLVLVGLQILALCWYLAAGMIQSKLRKRT